ncbi:MAG TPA: glycoside hydrolase family 28 protein [Terriglobales bacterium]|nr:glycoside hydrolase family 28 protein [Terriglobales bacterium]
MQAFGSTTENSTDPWSRLPAILARIKPPSFPDRHFDITKYGGVGDNHFDCTAAFEKAIAACTQAGGGMVLVPKGEFATGAIHLKSNVNFHLADEAAIRFIPDPAKYPLVFTRWEGVELMNYSPFIYAFEQENIAITGKGTLDGNSDREHWWPWKGRPDHGWEAGQPNQESDRNHLFEMSEKRVPVQERVFGNGHYLRPNFIQPYRCKNVLIEGVTIINSPMWEVHPVLSSNVTVRALTITSSGPNNDGCDPESCADVLIDNVSFNTGDDCIAIKSGRNEDGRRLNVPTQNVVVRNCHMKDGHGGVTIGSEITGGVHDVFTEDCKMDSPHLDSALKIKDNAMRGGLLQRIYARNIQVGQVSTAGVSIDFNYEEGAAGGFTPVVRDVEVKNLTMQKAKYAVYLRGLQNAPITGVHLSDCDFEGVEKKSVVENVKNISLDHVRINGTQVNSIS